jgi:hypothetical protein|tara:strand:+ start:208 stop:630 length:423 start_codon:yes stop_codon:yes gene_type:complete
MALYLTLHTCATFLTALLLGGMVCYAFFLTPLVFRFLDGPIRADFLRRTFPVYYRSGAVLAILAALPIWYRGEAMGLAAVGVAFVLVLALLLPPINRARDGRDAGDENAAARFQRLHRLSVMINLGQMVVVVAVFFRLVA